MIYSIRFFSNTYHISPITVLYLIAVVSLVVLSFTLPAFLDLEMDTWAKYNLGIGIILNIWGYIFGGCVVVFAILRILHYTVGLTPDSFIIRFTFFDALMAIIIIHNVVAAFVGVLMGNPLGLIAGDTYKGILISLLYFWTRNTLKTEIAIISTLKIVVSVEIFIFVLFYFTDFLPLSIASRTFLYTIAFTLFFEEARFTPKVVYIVLLILSLFIVITSAAYRGTVIVFGFIVILNFLLKVKKESAMREMFALALGGVLFVILSFIGSFTSVEKNIDVVSSRFESTTQGSHRRFGLEESVFQRVGETIDVMRSFQSSNPALTLVGFGNGALLNNTFITPSERSIYKTQFKHNIYITLLALLFRQGIVGFLLHTIMFGYVFWMSYKFYQYIRCLQPKREYVYLKMLLLYHISVIVYSFVAYIYIGNIFIGISFGIAVVLFQRMGRDVIEMRSKDLDEYAAKNI